MPTRAVHLLFICSGNTCRSPMAEGILRAKSEANPDIRLSVSSAGTGAMAGAPASPGAVSAVAGIGIDLKSHRSRVLDAETLARADVILVMAQRHKDRILSAYSGFSDRVFLLKEYGSTSGTCEDVDDPFGSDIETYRKCCKELESEITRILPLLTGLSRVKDTRRIRSFHVNGRNQRKGEDMLDAVILSATRTATGKFLGSLSRIPAPRLGAVVIKEAVERAGIEPSSIDEVIMGNVVSAGIGQAPARQAAIYGGIPSSAAAMTVNKVCGSGLKAVSLAAQAVTLGDADFVIAGGMENMSLVPYSIPKARMGLRMGNSGVTDLMIADGLWDPYQDMHMGMTGELVAGKYSISREAQDEYAINSHKKAAAAIKAGKFDREITPVPVPRRKQDPLDFVTDESVRENAALKAFARLKPAFKKDGTVTAGNAPGINDGASAVVVTSGAKAGEMGLHPIARIVGYAVGGLDPEWVMLAPIEAVKNLEKRTGLGPSDFDLIELNEAFSVQAMAVINETGMDPGKVNVNGGAVALGHAIGSSGCRILVTLIHALQDRGGKLGLATLCLGGGNAVAMAVELL